MRRFTVAGIYFGALTGADGLTIAAGALAGLCAASFYMMGRLLAEFLMRGLPTISFLHCVCQCAIMWSWRWSHEAYERKGV